MARMTILLITLNSKRPATPNLSSKRIQEIEEILKNYQIITDDGRPHDFVRVGDWVTVSEEGYDEDERYHLVGAAEADPTEGRISNESPLGKALLGAKVGDVVRVKAPGGITEFRVVKIE